MYIIMVRLLMAYLIGDDVAVSYANGFPNKSKNDYALSIKILDDNRFETNVYCLLRNDNGNFR